MQSFINQPLLAASFTSFSLYILQPLEMAPREGETMRKGGQGQRPGRSETMRRQLQGVAKNGCWARHPIDWIPRSCESG